MEDEPLGHQDTKEEVAPIPRQLDVVARDIVDCAFKVHSTLGPGLLESVYEACLAYEIAARGLRVSRQVAVPILYGDLRIDGGFRIDLLVEDLVIVEVKAVERPIPLFDAQVLTYMKLTGRRLGLIVNFNVGRIKDGIRRLAR